MIHGKLPTTRTPLFTPNPKTVEARKKQMVENQMDTKLESNMEGQLCRSLNNYQHFSQDVRKSFLPLPAARMACQLATAQDDVGSQDMEVSWY